MAGPFGDTFVDTAGANLSIHTPTGPNPGTSWVASDGVIVFDASNRINDGAFSASNQYCLSDDIGSDQMDVQLDITQLTASVGTRGVRTRTSTADAAGWEYSYDAAGGQWHIDDGTTSANFSEAWPGGTVTIKAEQRTGVGRLYANGALKVTLNSNLHSGRTRAGLTLSNFSASGPVHQADNFSAVSATDSPALASSYRTFPKDRLRYDLPEEVLA